jgi:hypothetical protein
VKLFELKSPAEVQELEAQLDDIMRTVGLDVKFTRHFVERILGREKRVTKEEVVDSFRKLKAKYKKRLIAAKKKAEYEAVLKDFGNDLNVVFGVDGPVLTAVTIKQKNPDQFHINNDGGDELKVK